MTHQIGDLLTVDNEEGSINLAIFHQYGHVEGQVSLTVEEARELISVLVDFVREME